MSNKFKRKPQQTKEQFVELPPEVVAEAEMIQAILDKIEVYVDGEDDGYYLMLSRDEAELLKEFIANMALNTEVMATYIEKLETQLQEKSRIWVPE